jgi:signal transduction histidine kinase
MLSELEAERRRADQAEQFAATLSRIGAAPGLEAALAVLARDAIALLRGDQGAVCAYGLENGPGSLAFWVSADGTLEPAEHPETLPGTVAGDLRAGGPARVIPDLWELDAACTPEERAVRRRGMRSSVAVPIVARERRIGSLHVDHHEVGFFGEADLTVAQALAALTAPVIERTQREELVRLQTEELALDNARLYREAQDQAAAHVQLHAALREAGEARDRALRAAREALGLRDKFLSLASHELRTPITSLRGYAQLLQRQFRRGRVEPDQVQRALSLIDHQSDKLARLAMQLLDTSRIETGTLVLERRRADLAALVREVVQSTRDVLAINAPVLQVDYTVTLEGPESVPCELDQTRLEQVLVNLLDNAIKYSPNGGPIHVTVEAPLDGDAACPPTRAAGGQPVARIAVRDRGVGVPPAHRERIFERFYQVRKRDNPSGMGLGLYVSRQIVELHGGALTAEFPPDGGSRFVVSLPLDAPRTAGSRRDSRRATPDTAPSP